MQLFAMPQANYDTREVIMATEFNSDSCIKVRNELIALSKMDSVAPIILTISSYGGSVDSLNIIIDTINSIPNEVYTVCLGHAMSAGAGLLSAGTKGRRFVAPSARVMIHAASAGTFGNVEDMVNDTMEVSRLNDNFLEMIAKNSKKNLKVIKKMLTERREIYLSASEAVKFGIADKVGVPSLVRRSSWDIVIK